MMQRISLIVIVCLQYGFGFTQSVTFTIDPAKTAQTIDNFGASGAGFFEGIDKFCPAEKKNAWRSCLSAAPLTRQEIPWVLASLVFASMLVAALTNKVIAASE